MRELGSRLATLLRAGDLVVLSGSLGAGKTTLAQGIGAGLHVRGTVTSPTFVIARVHPALADGPSLVHADAYRLGGRLEVDDLDLDASIADSVTLVEWGEGLVEDLADDRLEIEIARSEGDDDVAPVEDFESDDVRVVRVTGRGDRWRDVELAGLAVPGTDAATV
jgi:tRNA threonylcarbamoyladenosine biosynthesis protein TsaE